MSEFTKYEIARILGARALQLSMNAPILLKIDKKEIEEMNYDSIKIAEKELNEDVLPISVKRPMPERKQKPLKKQKREEKPQEEKEKKIDDKEIEEKEEEEEQEIKAEGEIMELATPEDEKEEVEKKPEV